MLNFIKLMGAAGHCPGGTDFQSAVSHLSDPLVVNESNAP
jgi:hypothetical protein